jgi:DNA-binding FadR family transcriptional regulator
LQRELTPLLAAVPQSQSALQKSNDEHRMIVAVISERDPERARLAVEAHVESTAEILIGLRHSRTRA